MLRHESAKKRTRQIKKRTAVNRARVSRVRTFVRKVELAIASGDADAARVALRAAQPEIDRGVSKGVVPKNRASRKLSRLSARVKAMSASVSPAS